MAPMSGEPGGNAPMPGISGMPPGNADMPGIAGIPAIPAIYQLSQTVSGNTLNVNVSTRSNN